MRGFFAIIHLMSSIALYRKYRPERFADVLGQEPIVRAISGALARRALSHAYLFAGSRGTGKTSVARIIARELGCSANDLYEIDAASNRGIDDVRELRESVRARPFDSPYKVYIIDEVHMLSTPAFNALLKTLEEPPEHTVFILATTELEKLPETIVSRCEVHTFKKPSRELLKQMVLEVAKKEGRALEPASAELIALLGDGSFRDTHGILQKVLSAASEKRIPQSEVEAITGAPRSELVNEVFRAIAERSAARGLSAVARAAGENMDMRLFLYLVLERLRAALLLRYAGDMEGALKEELTKEDFSLVESLAKDQNANISSRVLKEFLDAYQKMRDYHIPESAIEIALIRTAGGETGETGEV